MATTLPLTGSEHTMEIVFPHTGSEHTTATGIALTGSVSSGSRFTNNWVNPVTKAVREQVGKVFTAITKAVREQELGKAFICVAVSTVVCFKDQTSVPFYGKFAGACCLMGFVGIMVGLLGRYLMPRTAAVFEQLGIVMVFVAFQVAAWLLVFPVASSNTGG